MAASPKRLKAFGRDVRDTMDLTGSRPLNDVECWELRQSVRELLGLPADEPDPRSAPGAQPQEGQ